MKIAEIFCVSLCMFKRTTYSKMCNAKYLYLNFWNEILCRRYCVSVMIMPYDCESFIKINKSIIQLKYKNYAPD